MRKVNTKAVIDCLAELDNLTVEQQTKLDECWELDRKAIAIRNKIRAMLAV